MPNPPKRIPRIPATIFDFALGSIRGAAIGANGMPGTPVSENAPEITDLFVSRLKNGRMEITFSLINVPYGEATYIWAMINPDDVSTGEMVIFPRNPTFRGFPLDFRNGILFNRSAGKQCKINLSDKIAGIAVKKIRILAYSPAGKVLVNKEFTINQNSGM